MQSTKEGTTRSRSPLEWTVLTRNGWQLRVFNSSKRALLFVNAALSMPEYSMSDRELDGIRAVVNGDDYFRAHNDIGRAAIAAMTGMPLPPSFIPTSIPSGAVRCGRRQGMCGCSRIEAASRGCASRITSHLFTSCRSVHEWTSTWSLLPTADISSDAVGRGIP